MCYRCDEKFGPNHRCRSKSLQILLLMEDDELDKEKLTMEPENEASEEGKTLSLSMNSILGITFDSTMKIRRRLGDKEMIVLVDSGASHNFVSLELVSKLRLSVTGERKFTVTVGNGGTFGGKGIYKRLLLEIQGVKISQDFFPFELEGADVILGMPWL